MVRIAATVARAISIRNNARKPKATRMSWIVADDRSKSETQLEPDGQINERQDEGEQNGQHRLLLELPTDLGPHSLGSDHVEHVTPEGCKELVFDLRPHHVHLLLTQGGPDHELVVLAKPGDRRRLRAPESRPKLGRRGRLMEADLDERSAGEVDAVVLPAAYGEDVEEHPDDPCEDHRRRHRCRPYGATR